jgi:predicted RNA-binding protein YlqC (UPF0109 family)
VTDQPVADTADVPTSANDTADVGTSPNDTVDVGTSPNDTAEPSTVDSANQSPAPTATAVLTHVVRSIVDDADAVHVDAVEGRNRLKLEVKVGPGDLGRVIGRRGRTAQSIRTVVRAAATRDGVEVDVDFVD